MIKQFFFLILLCFTTPVYTMGLWPIIKHELGKLKELDILAQKDPVLNAVFTLQPDELQKALLEGGNPNVRDPQTGISALHLAVHNADMFPGHEDLNRDSINLVKILINHGADIDRPDIEGNTPLHYSLVSFKPEVVKLLLDANANPNLQNKRGETPLDVAKKQAQESYREYFKEIVDLMSSKL